MNIKILFATLILFLQAVLFAQVDVPPVSPNASVSQSVGFTNVLIEYNRPSLKGRELFGGIIQEGEVWRTGANMCTRLTLSEDISIEGVLVSTGKYSVYSIPGKEEWTLIINKKISWGTEYDKSMDVVRIKVPTKTTSIKYETLTFFFSDVMEDKSTLSFAWGDKQVDLKLSVETEERILTAIDKAMSNENSASGNDFYRSASYYHRKGLDKKKALKWIVICDDKKMKGKYFVKGLRAEIEASNFKYKTAIKSAKKALDLVGDSKNPAFVKRMNNDILEWEKAIKK